jgi:hypothetical protein
MKQTQLKFCIIVFILLASANSLFSQNMYVRLTSGPQSIYAINNIEKITFSSGEMLVQTPGATSNYQISLIRYVNFVDLVDIQEHHPGTATKISVYPNPAKHILHVNFPVTLSSNIIAEIFTPDGKMICNHNLKQMDSEDLQINISTLADGIYLLRVYNNHISETIRFIKN